MTFGKFALISMGVSDRLSVNNVNAQELDRLETEYPVNEQNDLLITWYMVM